MRALVTSVNNYHYSLRKPPKQRNSHQIWGGGLKSFLKIRPVGQPSCALRTDRRADIMKLKGVFRKFVNAPKSLSECHFTHPNLPQYHLYPPKLYLSKFQLTNSNLVFEQHFKKPALKVTPLVAY
jgi:hypothetical protein